MYENPLLPNAKLRELYATMLRYRSLKGRRAPNPAPPLEAVLAATLMHLQKGDVISPLPGNALSGLLSTEHKDFLPPTQQRLAVITGAALALKLARSEKLALAYLATGSATARTEAGWADAITYAARAELPLLLVCIHVERRSRTTNPKALTWTSLSKLAKPLRLPVLSVDGADAVAVYRVMQESALRGRTVGGTAVIWCSFPATVRLTAATDPLPRMKRYLAVRGLLSASGK